MTKQHFMKLSAAVHALHAHRKKTDKNNTVFTTTDSNNHSCQSLHFK